MTNPQALTSTITPYFTVADAEILIRFLTDLFDATLVKEDRYESGKIQHARLRIGDALIMLNESSEDYPANISQMHIKVDDTDATFEKAMKLGASPLMPPNLRPHGERMAGIKDPCGNIWWIASEPKGAVDP